MRRIARFTGLGRKISSDDFAKFETLLGEFIVKVYANRWANIPMKKSGRQSPSEKEKCHC